MDTLFNTLKKGLVTMLFIVVGFAMTYVPQMPTSSVDTVAAGGALSCAGPCSNLIEQRIGNGLTAAGNVSQSIVAGATTNLWIKENILDGIGWAIAKGIISGMVRSLINWVNSGFQGSPAFVSDLKGFLLNIADEEIGRFIQDELGDIGSFICSPFRLDVQISVALQYAQGRAGQTAPACTLSGIVANIEGFIAGIDPGAGLSDWLKITSTPQTYTPYGAILNAEVEARARLINAQGQRLTEVNWGDGFLSQKICEAVGGSTGGSQCSISKPGRVIADQLNKALGAGQDSLVAADEINELVAALLGQLANQVLTGAAGLLGLSGGTGFTYSGYNGSYVNELLNQADDITNNSNTTSGNSTVRNSILTQLEKKIDYYDVLVAYEPTFEAFVNDSNNSNNDRAAALDILNDIRTKKANTEADILSLTNLALQFENADTEEQVDILVQFTSINQVTDSTISNDQSTWSSLTQQNNINTPAVIRTNDLSDLINDINPAIQINTSDPLWQNLAADLGITL